MPYAICPMPARATHVTEKGYSSDDSQGLIEATQNADALFG